MNNLSEFENQLEIYQGQIEDRLIEIFSQNDRPQYENLTKAMKYATLGGGKRIRGILVLGFAKLHQGDESAALNFACAVEILHAYTLVHDDLPCMDNSDLRRGKPSVHKKFGEATAVLAGDGLLTLAFDILSGENNLPPENQLEAIKILAEASGYYGVVGGQMIDIENEGKSISYEDLKLLHRLKTGALIRAAVLIGSAVSIKKEIKDLKKIEQYGEKLGLSYQIIDDILDTTSSTAELGKPTGADEKNQKTTYLSIFGEEKAREIANEETEKAIENLKALNGDVSFLLWLTNYLLKRKF